MNPKVIAFILPCIIGIPILVMKLGAIGMWASTEQAMGQETSVPAPVANVGMFVAGAWQAHNARTEREEVFDPAAMTIHRRIEFTRPIAIEDVLFPGETAPREAFHHLYILARAPAYAMDECALILQDLATKCAAARTSVKQQKDGTYRLKTSYAFLPDHHMGDTSQIMRAHLAYERTNLTPNTRNTHVAAADLKALRIETYRAAMQACTDLRLQTGTCAISKLEFTLTEVEDRPGFYRVRAEVMLNWLKVGIDSEDIELNNDDFIDRVSGYFSAKPKDEPVRTAAAEPASSDEPRILRGGSAVRSAGSARFQKAGD